MNHRPAPSRPRPARRGTPRTRRTLSSIGGLAVLLTATIALAPAASATLPPPEPSAAPVPPPPPPQIAVAHFPPWAIAAIVAGTIVLSVATTLITVALGHMRRSRHALAAAAEPQPSGPSPATTPEADDGQAEILTSHQQLADYDRYRPGSR